MASIGPWFDHLALSMYKYLYVLRPRRPHNGEKNVQSTHLASTLGPSGIVRWSRLDRRVFDIVVLLRISIHGFVVVLRTENGNKDRHQEEQNKGTVLGLLK